MPRHFSAALVALFTFNCWADSVEISCNADTTLQEAFPSANLGATVHVAAGTTGNGARARGLFQFSLADKIPAGATISGASLRLSVVFTPPGSQPVEYRLHRVLK